MSYSVDKDKAYKAAKEGLEWIKNYRSTELEEAIQEEIANSEKWHKRIPFLFKKIDKEEALGRLQYTETLFSRYALIEISYGRMEYALKNIIKACENNSNATINIGEKDFRYLHF